MKTESDQTTIMIVDDEPENLNVLGEMLGMQGWQVQFFPRGRMALASALEAPPDLVLLDIRMPGMDGHELCQRFKADENLQAIPILFISALSSVEDIAAGLACGGVDYVSKPFHEGEVLARVRTHLALRRAYLDLKSEHAQLRLLERRRKTLNSLLVDDLRNSLGMFRSQFQVVGAKCVGTPPNGVHGGLLTAIEGMRVLNHVVSTGVYANQLVSDGIPLHRQAVSVCEIFHSVCESGVHRSAAHRISAFVAPACPSVDCDVDLTERIIANMVANALKNSPHNSQVVVSAGPVPGGVRIWVRDQGRGMPLRHQRYFEEDGVTAKAGEESPPSVGLGLFFCKLAVAAQGATMGVENDRGGNNLWLTLPSACAQ